MLADIAKERAVTAGYGDQPNSSVVRVRAILSGIRGAPPADIEALADMASRLSWLAYDLRDELEELDLNPVLVLAEGQGAVAVDALMVALR